MEIKPLQAIMIVAFAAALVGLATYAGTQARLVLGPSDLRIDKSDKLHLRIGQRVFVYNKGFTLEDSYSLDDIGVNGLLGSFDFYPNNDLLLVADTLTSGNPLDAGRLMRCSRQSRGCEPLEESTLHFRRSIRSHLDGDRNLFLADMSGDAVYWLDETGRLLDELPGEVRSPGQILRKGEHLTIANTDGKELLLVPLNDGSFAPAAHWQRIPMDAKANRSRREHRPTEFTYIDNSWYVLVKSADGRSGSVYRYNEEGEYRSHFTLPAGADPMAINFFGDSLVLADYSGMKVYRYTTDGRQLEALDSPEQRHYVQAQEARRRQFVIMEYTTWGIFALALLAGFAFGIRGELQKASEKKQACDAATAALDGTASTRRPHPMEADIHWISARKSPLWVLLLGLACILLLPLSITALGTQEPETQKELCAKYTLEIMIWGTTLFMLAIFIPLVIKVRTLVSTRLGFRDEWVLADLGNSSVYIARGEELLKVPNGFIIDGITVPTGNPKLALFKESELEQWLEPRLGRGQSLGAIAQMKWQWQHRRPVFVLTAIATMVALALVLALEFGWLEDRFDEWLRAQPACKGVEMDEAASAAE